MLHMDNFNVAKYVLETFPYGHIDDSDVKYYMILFAKVQIV